ncbi:allantoate deiminase [Haloferula luteola]|uniref:Allantoate deiminase n=1 Tax=Haloferula luteola TaxID=595692 RepID=A0A840V7H4_9BACT|nr:M20 family metallo-hydrolase [Haloferula luteola]MBB5351534.1 allantoate deiminase [Haloferula luteola]
MTEAGQRAVERLEALGRISDDPHFLLRTFLSPASRQAGDQVMEWMRAIGMSTDRARDGTLRGILPGSQPTARPLLLGSHLDTVKDAGKYDGPLGILTALAALETLGNQSLPFPVHLLAFSDEEGVRFHTTYLGSRSLAGPLDSETLAQRDASGTTVAAALAHEGFDDGVEISYSSDSILGYVEAHIEQGRVLEEAGEALGVVSAIAGQSRLTLTLTGRTDHAGTTPMPLRRDALAAAAECILHIEAQARAHPPLVATVGTLHLHPSVSNSIPGFASLSLDFRHPDPVEHRLLLARLHDTLHEVASRRELTLNWSIVQENPPVPCDPLLTRHLAEAIEQEFGICRTLVSGAGHDGVAISALGPIAMLMVRCRDGLSHHPDEFASPEDIEATIRVLVRFLKSLANT